MSARSTASGRMATERPARYAKQLAGHWSKRGPLTVEGETTTMRWETGQVIVMTAVPGALLVTVEVPEEDATEFAAVVARHLERFGQRDELLVVWD